MCYPKPGPRCSSHARAKLKTTSHKLKLAKADVLKKQTDLAFIPATDFKAVKAKAAELGKADLKLQEAREASENAKQEFETSPAGIKLLRSNGQDERADNAEKKRREMIDAVPRDEKPEDDEKLQALLSNPDKKVRLAAAENPATTPATLAALSRDREAYVRNGVARNPNNFPQTLVAMSRDEEWVVRDEVAQNPTLPLEALVRLADDENSYVRGGAAQNERLPMDVVSRLSRDPEEWVRTFIAKRNDLSLEMIQALSSDDGTQVRMSLAENKTIPTDIVVKLGLDEHRIVRILARKNPEYEAGIRKFAAENGVADTDFSTQEYFARTILGIPE